MSALDVSDVRDAIMQAQAEVQEAVAEAIAEFYKPDLELALAIKARAMTGEEWQLVDDDTRQATMDLLGMGG